MISNNSILATLTIAGLLGFATPATAPAQGTYKLLKEIPVGGEGSWDYLSVDEAGRRLYVSHGAKVVVIDIDQDKVAGEIPDTPGVHGVAIASDLGHGFSSNGRENKSSMVDLKTLKTLSKVDTGQGPDGMLYEPGRQEVYLFNGHGESATVIDAKSGKVTATVPLEGKPEFGAADPGAGRVYDNLEDKSEVVAIDTKAHKVVNQWPVAPGEEPSGMAIDAAHHRLFLGCGNKKMLMMNSTDGKVLADVPIGQGVDATAFDPGTQLAFASCGDGTVTIAHEDSPDKLTLVQTLKTEPRAKTMTIDTTTHKIYLGSAKFEAPPPTATPPEGGRRQRPRMIPDTFKILVYGLESAAAK